MQKFEAWKGNIFNFFPQHFCTRPIAQPTKKILKLEFHFNTEYFLQFLINLSTQIALFCLKKAWHDKSDIVFVLTEAD
jgi:hypothetical protein